MHSLLITDKFIMMAEELQEDFLEMLDKDFDASIHVDYCHNLCIDEDNMLPSITNFPEDSFGGSSLTEEVHPDGFKDMEQLLNSLKDESDPSNKGKSEDLFPPVKEDVVNSIDDNETVTKVEEEEKPDIDVDKGCDVVKSEVTIDCGSNVGLQFPVFKTIAATSKATLKNSIHYSSGNSGDFRKHEGNSNNVLKKNLKISEEQEHAATFVWQGEIGGLQRKKICISSAEEIRAAPIYVSFEQLLKQVAGAGFGGPLWG